MFNLPRFIASVYPLLTTEGQKQFTKKKTATVINILSFLRSRNTKTLSNPSSSGRFLFGSSKHSTSVGHGFWAVASYGGAEFRKVNKCCITKFTFQVICTNSDEINASRISCLLRVSEIAARAALVSHTGRIRFTSRILHIDALHQWFPPFFLYIRTPSQPISKPFILGNICN